MIDVDAIWKDMRCEILIACGDGEYGISIDMIKDALERAIKEIESKDCK